MLQDWGIILLGGGGFYRNKSELVFCFKQYMYLRLHVDMCI